MSGNNHLFKNRYQLGATRRKATVSTPDQVVARMAASLERYTKQHAVTIFDRGEDWIMIELAPGAPLLLIEFKAVYGDETATFILVRTQITRKYLYSDGIDRSSNRCSSERSALQHIFNTIHTLLRDAPAALERS